uniref:Uncharacterized protein n=1 Tax=Rhizophora mucronata TaxID=61149 RepID=A0A2P2NAT6_RHIMU
MIYIYIMKLITYSNHSQSCQTVTNVTFEAVATQLHP